MNFLSFCSIAASVMSAHSRSIGTENDFTIQRIRRASNPICVNGSKSAESSIESADVPPRGFWKYAPRLNRIWLLPAFDRTLNSKSDTTPASTSFSIHRLSLILRSRFSTLAAKPRTSTHRCRSSKRGVVDLRRDIFESKRNSRRVAGSSER